MAEKCESFHREAAKLEEEFTSENLDDSHKQALCSNLETVITKLHSSHTAIIQIVKSVIVTFRNLASETTTMPL